MQIATTLIHKGAMPIAVHAVESFARYFRGLFRLRIHSDGSLDSQDEQALLELANGLNPVIVRPADRAPLLRERLANAPRTSSLLEGGAYFTKMQLPVCEDAPYFYFDSDIVWLRRVENLVPENGWNAFSTESWSWYYGAAREREWIRTGTPRRVNSGFYFLNEPFPAQRMEDMLAQGLFDPSIPYNTDQEIMAYLYPKMRYYHPEDLKRTRVGRIYDLDTESCAALHFPGKMWLPHMDAIKALKNRANQSSTAVRYQNAVPVSRAEFLRMRWTMKMAGSTALRAPIQLYRKLRHRIR